MLPAVAASAYRIGSIMKFKGVDFLGSVDSIAKKTAEKMEKNAGLTKDISSNLKSIGKTQKKIDKSKDVQKEILDRQEKFLKNTNSKPKQEKAFGNVFKAMIQKPVEALQKLLLGLIIALAPRIIDRVKKLINQVRLIGAQFSQFLSFGGRIISNSIAVVTAIIQNNASFDFTDRSKRLSSALDQWERDFNNDFDDLNALASMWELGPKELDDAIKALERGEDPRTAAQPQTPAFGNQPGGSGGAQGEWSSLLNVIGQAESDGSGGYNAMNRNVGGQYPGGHSDDKFGLGDLTSMTVGQIQQLQSRGDIFAAGRYQIIPDTLNGLVSSGAVSPGDKFDPKTQDQLAIRLIQNRGVTPSMARNNPTEAGNRLAPEWAGLPVLSDQQGNSRRVTAGQSYYAGDGTNQATVSQDQLRAGLQGVGTTSPSSAPSSFTGSIANTQVVDELNVAKNTSPLGGLTPGQGFGAPRDGGARLHQGLDIGTYGARGFKVALRAEGTVARVSFQSSGTGGYGHFVIIEVPSMNKSFMFAHLANTKVRQGEKYTGQVIGEIGGSGGNYDIHLHFEVYEGRAGGKAIDPYPYLGLLSIGRNIRGNSNVAAKLNIDDIGVVNKSQSRLEGLNYDYDAAERLESQNTQVVMMTQPIIARQTTVVNKTSKSGGTTISGGSGGGRTSAQVFNLNLLDKLS